MAPVGRALQDLGLLALFALIFLGTVNAFLGYRWRRALDRGEARLYVPHADPWLPALLALIGAAWFALLR